MGSEEAHKVFSNLDKREEVPPYYIVHVGREADRTDVDKDKEKITYLTYDPPFLDQPYSIQRVKFEPQKKDSFIYHAGEEILAPIAGEILYQFYWSQGREEPKSRPLKSALQHGSIIRINPQVPHHTWARGEPAEAWMIFRDLSDALISIGVDSVFTKHAGLKQSPRHITEEELRDPGRYALTAWGLAEHIRCYRERANLDLTQLADACGIDTSHLSRIEKGITNVSLDVLMRIARCLGLNLEDLVCPSKLPWEIAKIPTSSRKREAEPSEIWKNWLQYKHLLHATHWRMPSKSKIEGSKLKIPKSAHSSWILLTGEVKFKYTAEATSTPQVLESSGVLHLRREATESFALEALEESQLLHITYSTECMCNRL